MTNCNRKSNKTKYLISLLALALVLAFFIAAFSSATTLAYAVEDHNIFMDYDGKYHIFVGDNEIKTLEKNELDTVEKQKTLLKDLDLQYPNYSFNLRKGYSDVALLDSSDNKVEYGFNIGVVLKNDNPFGGFIPNLSSYSWHYVSDTIPDTIVNNNNTTTLAFGNNLEEKLPIGIYKVYCSYTYEYSFGGKDFISSVSSNPIEIEIIPTYRYGLNVPDRFYTLHVLQDPITHELRPCKLKEIDMSNNGKTDFYNLEGDWSLSTNEDPERELTLGDNNVKCIFTPKNPNLLPREVDVVICAVEKQISIIVKDAVFCYGDPIDLKYETVKGTLYEGDTVDSLGIELYLISRKDGHRILEDEIEPDGYYYIGGSIKSNKYKVVVETIESYYDQFITYGRVNVLKTSMDSYIAGAGTVTLTQKTGFPYKFRISTYSSGSSIPNSMLRAGESVFSTTNFNFEEFDKNVGDYTYVPCGEVTLNYVTDNNDISALAYLDFTGWHKIEVVNGRATAQVKDLKAITLFTGYPLEVNWPPIVTSVLLGISIGIMIVLLVKRFGGIRK